MNAETPAYGLWGLVIINSVVFILFAYSFFKPRTHARLAVVRRVQRLPGRALCRDVRLSAHDLLPVRVAAKPLSERGLVLPRCRPPARRMMFGWKANPHFGPFHILSFVFIGGGFVLILCGLDACSTTPSKRRNLATTGPYSYVRHPQYVGFILVMFGFLLQWPTIADAGDVSGAHRHVRQARKERGARCDCRVRRCLSRVYGKSAGILPAPQSFVRLTWGQAK